MAKALVPYASSLAKLRALLQAAVEHRKISDAGAAVGLEPGRHPGYYAEAAEVLGLARRDAGKLRITRRGHELLATPTGSKKEASVFRRAIDASAIGTLLSDLLSSDGVPGGVVARLIALGVKPSMAKQRGEALERWRDHILKAEHTSTQIELPLARAHGASYEGRAMLRRLEIRSFKAFGEGKRTTPALDTPALTLLAGPNGAGKSTILQALDVLGSLVRGNIQQLLQAHEWEYRDLPHLLSSKQTMTVTVDVELGEKLLRWSLTLGARRSPGIAAEKVERIEGSTAHLLLNRVGRNVTVVDESSGEPLTQPPITLTESWLRTRDPKADREAYPGLLALKAWAETIFPLWSLDPMLLRAPSRGETPVVGARGGDLASFLFRLKRRDKERFEEFIDRVQRHYPRLVGIEPKSSPYGWKKLTISERWGNGDASFNARQVSDGLLRLLAVASIPDWETRPSLVLLDEIENGLHPRLIASVTSLLQEISRTTQIIATTHSPITLNYVPAESTQIVTRNKSGAIRITPLPETYGFAKLREHFEPGELWYNVGEERLVR